MDIQNKKCKQCTAEKNLVEDFGIDASKPDGRRQICRECFNSNRAGKTKQTPEAKRLKMHTKIVAEAKKRLTHPELLTPGELAKMEQIVRLEDERLEKLQTKVTAQREETIRVALTESAGPSLQRVRALGSELFAADGSLLNVEDRPAQLAILKAALETLTGPADEAARAYLQTSIQALETMLANSAEREKFLAEESQVTINGRACQAAADAIHAKFDGLFSEGMSTIERDKLRALFVTVREQAQQQHKTIKPDEVAATGANRKIVSSRILEELTGIAGRLGKAGIEVGPGQSLENFQDFEWHGAINARQMRQYVRELTAKLEAARATMTPEEYKKKYLELPVAPKEENIIWKVPLLNGTEEWMWPSGKIVRRGVDIGTAEVVKDALHGWVLAPSPVGATADDENKPAAKLELIQDPMDCNADGAPKWKWVPEGSQGVWEQRDGSWKRTDIPSPWSAPEKVTFRVGPAQPDAEHCEFRSGFWFTEAEVIKAERGPDLKLPPVLFPPLTRTKADSIAVEPPMTAEELAKWSREPSRWKRHVEREKFQKEQEAALLKGTYIWDKNLAAK